MNPSRKSFMIEKSIAELPSAIPKRHQVRVGIDKTPSLDFVVGELIREPGYCDHVQSPLPPVHIYGIPPEKLRDREKHIVAASKLEIETYTRRGKTHSRVQRRTTPILLSIVCSWPEPTTAPSTERDRWVRRVTRLFKRRFGTRLRSVLMHLDESFAHLHAWIDDDGRPVARMHAGKGSVLDLLDRDPGATRKTQAAAYKDGCSRLQSWFHSWAGAPFGHVRNLHPRPRVARSTALRDRQAKIESEEADLVRRKAAVKAAEQEILQHAAKIRRALTLLQKREEKVQDLRAAVEDQLSLERIIRKNTYEAPSVF